MNDLSLLPDDPRLTAYALGELDADQRLAIEAALRRNPALLREVDEIRRTVQQLESALAAETVTSGEEKPVAANGPVYPFETDASAPTPAPSDESAAPTAVDSYRPQRGRGKLIRFPQFYYLVGGVAAAGFAVMVALHRDEFEVREIARVEALRSAMQKRGEAARQAGGESAIVSLPLVQSAESVADAAAAAPAFAASAPVVPSATARALVPSGLTLLEQTRQNATGVTLSPFETQVADAAQAKTPARERTQAEGARTAGGEIQTKVLKTGSTRLATTGQAQPITLSSKFGGVSGAAEAKAVQASASGSLTLGAMPSTRTLDARYAPGGGLDLYPGPPRVRPEPGAPPSPAVALNTETYSLIRDNAFLATTQNPLSTFSVDVDTAGYSNLRRFLTSRRLPPPDAVRIEELLNYFPFRYSAPTGEAPFAVSLEVAESPWTGGHQLVRIGVKGREITAESRPAANLVFLIDVSGSMNQPNKLPLVKESLRMLVGKLRSDDRVSLVTYAGNSGLALPSTPVARSREILEAIEALQPGGSTNGAMGIHLAYDIAKANFMSEGVNRVILCTDGDFNVGVTSSGELVRLIEDKAKSKVFLTVLGFGMGNLKDGTLEQLADKGNGQYGYIDNRREAQRMLVDDLTSTLVTIAKDVKIQVEFNPTKVASYRLIGYENRVLAKEDFANDKVDAGEIGAGHTVTALYEIVPVESAAASKVATASVDELRYQVKSAAVTVPPAVANELLTVKVRYKEPQGDESRKLEFPLAEAGKSFANASVDFRFAAAVAQFGMILRKSEHRGTATLGHVLAWALDSANSTDDPRGYRAEFLDLVRQAQELMKTE